MYTVGDIGAQKAAILQIPVSLIDQEAIEKVIPLLSEKGVAVIARAPLAQGVLTDAQHETSAEQSTRCIVECSCDGLLITMWELVF